MASPSQQESMEAKRKRCAAAALRRVNGKDEHSEQEKEPEEVAVVAGPETKKPRLTWNCSRCTYENVSDAVECAMCGKQAKEESGSSGDTQQWTCLNCTLLNDLSSISCTACGAAKEGISNAAAAAPKAPLPSLDQVRVMTLNVSSFETSFSAPPGYDPMETFSTELLRNDPDVICIQEATDSGDAFYETLLPGYVCLGAAESHNDYAMLFVKPSWAAHATRIKLKGGTGYRHGTPAVLARVRFAGDQTLVVGTCHLAPSSINAYKRLSQVKEMLRHCRPNEKLLIAGDTNIRQQDDKKFEELGLLDAWREDGSDFVKKFTWNARRNKFHVNNNINIGRYDRMYFRGLTVEDFQMCLDQPLSDNPGHFLSDHFGLRAIFNAGANE